MPLLRINYRALNALILGETIVKYGIHSIKKAPGYLAGLGAFFIEKYRKRYTVKYTRFPLI
jgi:hypothetical protein